MILKMNRKSKGKKGVVEYLLNEREAQGTAQTLRGNPELTKSLIKHINRKHKYLSGGLMFAKEEYLNDIQQKEIMDSFEELLFTGLDQDQYHVLWVRHTDKNRLELNFVVPRIELNRGIDLDLYSHKRDLPVFDMWKNGINKKYDLADPNDPARARSKSEQNKHAPFSGSIIANREKLDETLYELVYQGEIKSRSHMLELLEKSGYQIARKGADYISIKHTDIGKKALRLRGGIFSENFTSTRSIESIIKDGKQRAREHYTQATRAETETSRRIYQKYLQTRTERHKKRYQRPKRAHKEEPQAIKTRNILNLDTTLSNHDERMAIDDRIRKFIEKSNSQRTEYTKEARERETQLLAEIRNSNIKLSNSARESEQEVLESIANARNDVAKNIRKYSKQVDTEIDKTVSNYGTNATRIHGLFTTIHEQFSRLKKSIEGAINGIKKLKIFNTAKDQMMSNTGPTINLSPRR